MHTFVTYVNRSPEARVNLEQGLSANTWGWTAEVAEQPKNAAVFALIQPGDVFVLAHHVSSDAGRAPLDAWANETFEEVYRFIVTGTQTDADDDVWSSDTRRFPYRVDLEPVDSFKGVSAAWAGDAFMEDARRSSVRSNAPVIAVSNPLVTGDAVISDGGLEPKRKLTDDEILERRASVVVRAEQKKIRREKLGSVVSAPCDLCGREFPVRIIRMAHIKARAKCDDTEKRDWENNIMAACIECDLLFERGDLIVDANGIVAAGVLKPMTGDLAALIATRVGRTCEAHDADSAKYFAHRLLGPPVEPI